MIAVDNHPEELLDRIASDTASADDLQKFEEHARQCPACAAHRTILPTVRSALAPSLEDKMRNEHAVSRAMSTLTVGTRRRAPRGVWLLAAAAILVAGVAGARYWAASRPQPSAHATEPPAPAEPVNRAAEPTNSPAAPEIPSQGNDMAPTVDTSKTRSPDARETAAQVFGEANELRRTGKDAQAMTTYRKVERLFPGTPEAQQSYATLGSLMMEHGGAEEALSQFDHYIERGGPLLVDVLAGKANALQRLGRTAEERRTWETLLDRFPKSVHAARAKTRLAELH